MTTRKPERLTLPSAISSSLQRVYATPRLLDSPIASFGDASIDPGAGYRVKNDATATFKPAFMGLPRQSPQKEGTNKNPEFMVKTTK
jgi:hypothetical protein